MRVGADRGKSVMEPSSTPSSGQQVYPIVFVKTKYVALLSFVVSATFILILIFYVLIMSRATHRPSTDTSIDMDVNELISDANIALSTNLIDMVRKATTKINQEILRLMFIQPRTEEITTRVDRLLLRSQCLSVSCVIFIYKIVHLPFLIIYPDMS